MYEEFNGKADEKEMETRFIQGLFRYGFARKHQVLMRAVIDCDLHHAAGLHSKNIRDLKAPKTCDHRERQRERQRERERERERERKREREREREREEGVMIQIEGAEIRLWLLDPHSTTLCMQSGIHGQPWFCPRHSCKLTTENHALPV